MKSSKDSASAGRAPKGVKEFRNFSDSIHQSMCIVRDKVLTLQGKPTDFTEENVAVPPAPQAGMRRGLVRGARAGPSRYRDNRLVAYHARSGKLQWMRQAGESDVEAFVNACFVGPPVPYADLVLIPVLEGHGMYLVAIDIEGGATKWRTFLCDEPGVGMSSGSPVMVAVDGGEAYVATGAGLVFSVDAISGVINWAVRYPRTPENASEVEKQLQRFGGFVRQGRSFDVAFDGWEEMIIPSGNAVIVTPSDFNHVIAFDRRTGALLWESARRPGGEGHEGEYALGTYEGRLYIAGNDVVRCYNVKGGRMLWEVTFEPGFGRGALTPDGIYIPSDTNKVLQLRLQDGERVAEYSVETEGGQPLGNLYGDGQRLFGMGLRRVYAIGKTQPAAEELSKPIE